MTPEQIAADVSARYGMPVMPGAYKACPANTYTWQIEGRNDEIKTWKEMQATSHANAARWKRVTKAAAPMSELGREIVRMYQAGENMVSIAIALKTSPRNVRNKLKAAGVYDPARSHAATVKAAIASNKARKEASKDALAIGTAQAQEGGSTWHVGGVL